MKKTFIAHLDVELKHGTVRIIKTMNPTDPNAAEFHASHNIYPDREYALIKLEHVPTSNVHPRWSTGTMVPHGVSSPYWKKILARQRNG